MMKCKKIILKRSTEKWPPTMYVKLAVMRWVKLFIVGQPADQKM